MITEVPFAHLNHLLTVPVAVNGTEMRFIFDTGIGINLISESAAAAAGCTPSGQAFTGRRMSGQEVTIPMGSIRSLRLGSHREEDVAAGIFEMASFDGVAGFLSLDYFKSAPVTVDYSSGLVIVEDAGSLARRAATGTPVGVRVEQDGCSTTVLLSLDLPGGQPVTVEVDSGSDALILDEAFAAGLGIDLADPGTRKIDGQDETGNTFTRYFAAIPGAISVTGAPMIRQADPAGMFQKIIYDGLAGTSFLRNFVITYDIAGSRMIFAMPG